MNRQSEKNPDFDYEVYPTPREIERLLNERKSSSKESPGKGSIFTTVAPYYNTPVTKRISRRSRLK